MVLLSIASPYWQLRRLHLLGFTRSHAQGAGLWRVKRVLNLTDVGHLTSDADDGEDKLEKALAKTGKSVWEVAEFYIDKFLEDYKALN